MNKFISFLGERFIVPCMQVYKTKTDKLKGTDFHEVYKKAFGLYQQIRRKTKRRPYVRSAYFKKDKVFLGLFWHHLWDKHKWQDRMRRLKFFSAALELIQNSHCEPCSRENPNKHEEMLHRFAGSTRENELFFVQIKEDKKTGQKYLISIFPA